MGERSQPSHLPVSGGLHAQRQRRKQAPPSFSAFSGGPSDDESGSLFPRQGGNVLPLQSAPCDPLLSSPVVTEQASTSHARHDITTAEDGDALVHPIESNILIPIKPGTIKHDDDTEREIKLFDRHQQSIIRSYTSDFPDVQKRMFDFIRERRSQSPSQDICEVERDPETGGIKRVRYAPDIPSNCSSFGGSNALRRFTEHFVHNQLGVKEPFVCYDVTCSQHFSLAHVRDRHEQTIHHMFRPKAYKLALNPPSRRTNQPASSSTTRQNAPITIIVWSPSTNSSQVQSPSTAHAPGRASRTRPGSPADMQGRRRSQDPYPRSPTPIPPPSPGYNPVRPLEAILGGNPVGQVSGDVQSRRGLHTPGPFDDHRAIRAWIEVTPEQEHAPPMVPHLPEPGVWEDVDMAPNTMHQIASDERCNPQASWTGEVSPPSVSQGALHSFPSHAAAVAQASSMRTPSPSSHGTADNSFNGPNSTVADSPDMYNRVVGVHAGGPQNPTSVDQDLLFIFLMYRTPTDAPPTGPRQSNAHVGGLPPRHHPATGISHSIPEMIHQADFLPRTHLQADIPSAAGANFSHVSDREEWQRGRHQNSSQMPQSPQWDQVLDTLSRYGRSQSPRTIADSASLSWNESNGSSHTYPNGSFQQ